MIRSEVQAEIDATRAAMAKLRLAVGRAAPRAGKPPKSAEQAAAAASLRALDDAYAAANGAPLNLKGAPQYNGPRFYGHRRLGFSSNDRFRYCALNALARVRDGQAGVRPETLTMAALYFASIWPASAPWPDHIDRPHIPQDKETDR